MTNAMFDKYVADIAKEIVVAKLSNSNISPNDENGKAVAQFYNEIFDGIRAKLMETDLPK